MQSIVHMYTYVVTRLHWKIIENTQSCDVFNGVGGGRAPSCAEHEADNNSCVKTSKTSDLDSFFYQLGSIFCIWIVDILKGEGAASFQGSPPPPQMKPRNRGKGEPGDEVTTCTCS